MKRKKFWIGVSLALCLLPVIAVIWHYKLIALGWYRAGISSDEGRVALVSRLAVTIEAKPVEGIKNNLSGLSHNEHTDTLFAVINSPAQIAEITKDGDLLRLIPVLGIKDIEGISHVEDDVYVLFDERRQDIYRISLNENTREIDVANMPRLGLGIMLNNNRGFEGITWGKTDARMFVAKEKSPTLIFEINGLTEWQSLHRKNDNKGAMNLQIHEWHPKQPYHRFMRDLSSLSLDNRTGHLLILSDESRLLIEYDKDANLVGIMPLWRGWHDLKRSIPQAEGATTDDQGNIYIVSEPNLFYRFERRETSRVDN
ncbi:MAG: SdiA-regulated domain-containing protein [Azoarcus sp.]|nr:SdiA-regulated domain-containing protein [Azoarcus sp.]